MKTALPQTVAELLNYQAARQPELLALEWLDGKVLMTYGKLRDTAFAFSQVLRGHVESGKRVALIGPSGPEFSLAALSTMISHSVAPLDNRLTPRELDFYLGLIRPEAILVVGHPPAALADCTMGQTVPQLRFSFTAKRYGGESGKLADSSTASVWSEAAVFLTSGSTGVPKIVPLTHRNIFTSATQICTSTQLNQADRGLVLWAQFHVGGIVDLLIAPLLAGSTLINGGLFSLENLAIGMANRRPSWIQFVPATLSEAIRNGNRLLTSTSSPPLRFIRCVAAELSPELMLEAEEFFDAPVITTYGMTEASPLITSTPLDPRKRVLGSVGKSCGTRIRIADQQGRDVPTGNVGEIHIAGPNVFAGYQSFQTKNTVAADGGWFATGDLGRLDVEGNLFLEGRKNDQINVGGAKFSPVEVERELRKHPKVTDVVVFGVEHATLGEVPVAVYSAQTRVDPHELFNFVSRHLSAFKAPRDFFWVPALPITKSRKVDRNAVRSAYISQNEAPTDPRKGSLEALVAQVWSQELDLVTPPLNKSFGLAGGDSLSAVRLISEFQSRSLGAAEWTEAEVVRMTLLEMVNRLEGERGAEGGGPLASQAKGAPEKKSRAHHENLLKVEDFISAISSAASPIDQRIGFEKALNYLTAGELLELARHAKAAEPLTGDISPGSGSNWVREVVSPSINCYRRILPERESRFLVAFTGHWGRLMMPINRFLALVPISIDSVIVTFDPQRCHYRPNQGAELRDLFRALCEVQGFNPRLSTSLGTSSGALPALAFSMFLEGSPVAMVGPDILSRHSHLSREIFQSHGQGNDSGKIRLLTGWMERDLEGAREIKELFPATSWRKFPTRSHNPLHASRYFGLTRQFVKWLTFDDLVLYKG